MQSPVIGCCQLEYVTCLDFLSFCVASSASNPDNELSERQSLMRTIYKLFLSNSVSKGKNNQAASGHIGTALGVSSGFGYFKVHMISSPPVTSVDLPKR